MMRMLAVWIALLALLGPGMAQQPAGGWIQGFFQLLTLLSFGFSARAER
jgi:hypothetical protein